MSNADGALRSAYCAMKLRQLREAGVITSQLSIPTNDDGTYKRRDLEEEFQQYKKALSR